MITSKTKATFQRALWVSAIVHAFAVLTWIVVDFAKPAISLEQKSIEVSVVRLGKKRDEKLLPRKAQEEQSVEETAPEKSAPPPKKVEQHAQPKVAKTAPQKPESPKKNTNKLADAFKKLSEDKKSTAMSNKRLNKIFDRLKEGSEHASPEGNSVTGELIASYDQLIQQRIQQSYEIPSTLSESLLSNLEMRLVVKIGARGEMIDVRMLHSSGNAVYDQAVLMGTKSIASFGPPPIMMRREYARFGREVRLCPVRCK